MINENQPTGNYNAPNGGVFDPPLKYGLLVALYHGFIAQPSFGPDVNPDLWHSLLEQRILGEDKMVGCEVYNSGPGPDIIWHYPVYSIEKAEYIEKPGQANEFVVQIKCETKYWANNTPASLYYWYNVTYAANGIASSSADSDWKDHPSAPADKKRPDFVWIPTPVTGVGAYWQGKLNYGTIRAIVPAP